MLADLAQNSDIPNDDNDSNDNHHGDDIRPFFTCHPHASHICLYFPVQGVTALWLVLIASTHIGMARLS